MHFNIKNILISHGLKDKDQYKNIYINLYEALKNAIIEKALLKDSKLPPSRILAKDLDISRSTVLKAYDLLMLEKYIKSIPGSGHFISWTNIERKASHLKIEMAEGKYPKISKLGKSFKKNIHIFQNSSSGVAFRPGLPPLDIFPVQQWKNLSNDYWKTVQPSQLSYGNTLGLNELRKNIANYLKIYRNINCSYEQVVITTGSLHSLYLIGSTLIDTDDGVVIEDPTYPRAYNLFKSLKAKVHSIPVDNDGIIVDEIKDHKVKLAYTTPSNQYPSGVKMSVDRRLALLNWASKKGVLIVEDDYDHEFSNWENPLPSIYSLDIQQRVVYLGTFNKLLHPSLRIGYMILPDYLIDTVKALYAQSSRFVPTSTQQTLSSFIEKDYLNKHLRRVIEVSIERKKVFMDSFNLNFDGEICLDSSHTGLHLIGSFKAEIDDFTLSKHLVKHGIITHPYSNYFTKGRKKSGLVLGYCSINSKLIKEQVNKMSEAYMKFENN
ncbi:GntR family transcriptional regulator [Flavobacteriaceae bacterium MAR_2010_72]|nr:GntR family transcriptional regulator [Flavobacteriaceae bacterium MAR_2010_72]TVZ58148.1 GntR family transcriptional regulator/MocR family aminotransferase [Flavobacteriaceae bacterium MAR_2010_105]